MAQLIVNSLPYLLEGLGITVALAISMLALGLVIGPGLALMQVYGRYGAPLLATLFERFFRAVPAVVLLFLFYYGISSFYNIPSFPAAVLALGLRTASYQSQIFRGAIQSVPTGQMTAARSIGLSQPASICFVIMPQALRQAIGPWTNEALSELKDTSLAYTIGVVELMRHASYTISANYGHTLSIYVTAAAMYLIVSLLTTRALSILKRKLAIPGFEHT
ncbi:amino acid ABC transporter permease [Salinisphaera sp. USBA-960]|uniref:amino acid ABC transporter permease n=1 Tax=Salinisphaera orenii TaxID=856731 RepID=UPI000DBE26ED|nr:amino acid ABC transporter permease [Salifodinibacter halophilus]NNC25729.1 amino acid ABC transporter permease [Salifodinibacter halophilus]